MIVGDPPYELVAIFADADAKLFFEHLIERGQVAGQFRRFRWRSLRDARRDAFRADPVAVVEPFRGIGGCRFMFSWDHAGSGREHDDPFDVEAELVQALHRVGVSPEDVLAVAFVPELEGLLQPVWPRVKAVIADVRHRDVPSDAEILELAGRRARRRHLVLPTAFDEAFASNPKEVFEGLLSALNLPRSASYFQQLGQHLSIPGLRARPEMDRVFRRISAWFPTAAV